MSVFLRPVVSGARLVSRPAVWRPVAWRGMANTMGRSDQNPEHSRPTLAVDAKGNFEQIYPGDPRFSAQPAEITTQTGKKIVLQKGEVVADVHMTLEWTLPSPPPLHQFEESPIVKETV